MNLLNISITSGSKCLQRDLMRWQAACLLVSTSEPGNTVILWICIHTNNFENSIFGISKLVYLYSNKFWQLVSI